MTSPQNGKRAAAAQPDAEPQRVRRFYTDVSIAEADDGAALRLDDRAVRTPGRAELRVPTRPLAEAIADEWRAQDTHIEPATMPLTRMANTVIDGVSVHADAVREDLVKFAGTDLVCYRAETPRELVHKQAEAWDPLLQWAREDVGATLVVVNGIMPVSQPDTSIAAIRNHVASVGIFALGPLHQMVTLTGSAVLALAVMAERITPDEGWHLAHIDEDWQISQWGEDAEAAARRAEREANFRAAVRFLRLSGGLAD